MINMVNALIDDAEFKAAKGSGDAWDAFGLAKGRMHRLLHIANGCVNGWVLIGETDEYCALHQRAVEDFGPLDQRRSPDMGSYQRHIVNEERYRHAMEIFTPMLRRLAVVRSTLAGGVVGV